MALATPLSRNVGHISFKAGGVFDKARWRADQIAMDKRNRFSQSGTGRKRKLDDDGELVEEPVYPPRRCHLRHAALASE